MKIQPAAFLQKEHPQRWAADLCHADLCSICLNGLSESSFAKSGDVGCEGKCHVALDPGDLQWVYIYGFLGASWCFTIGNVFRLGELGETQWNPIILCCSHVLRLKLAVTFPAQPQLIPG